jgi:hypothetical protein
MWPDMNEYSCICLEELCTITRHIPRAAVLRTATGTQGRHWDSGTTLGHRTDIGTQDRHWDSRSTLGHRTSRVQNTNPDR